MGWTTAQEKAMTERGRTLLVSAAAGSGKTAVLTQRIIKILTEEGGDISRFLIVTFTRAAAGELRQRISEALTKALETSTDKEHLSRQLMLLGGAHISTIDSFYLDLVRANFQAADFPPAFRLADDAELEPLRREAMNDTIDTMLEEEPDFVRISDIFCNIKQEGSLGEALIEIYDKLNKYPESIDILLRSAAEIEGGSASVLDTKFGEIYKNTLQRYAKYGLSLFDEALAVMATEKSAQKLTDRLSPLYTELRDHCRGVLNALDTSDYEALRAEIGVPLYNSTGKGGYPACSEEFVLLRSLAAEFRDAWKKDILPLGVYSPEEIDGTAAESAQVLRMLHVTLKRYAESYQAAKKLREIAEFSDISRAAYRLLVDKDGSSTPLAREIAESFDAIYIDEYQDVDAMQDATFKAIAKPDNRFMVGDIKQSIYRFRGAQPAVFAGYRKDFTKIEDATDDDKEAMIFMSDCFRCDKKIIDFSNTVSGYLFSHNAESIDYSVKDDLHFKKEREIVMNEEPPCRVMVLNRNKKNGDEDEEGESPAALELEAKMIAAEISHLLCVGEKVDGSPVYPKDIAVLMRSSSLAKPLARELAARHIPTNDTSQQRFFENPEVLCMYSLLAAIDNPFRDVYLAAALRSPFFGFTLEELVYIRGRGDASLSLYEALQSVASAPAEESEISAKIADFSTRFRVYRQKAQALPVDKLIRFLYKDTHVMAFAGYEEQENGTLVRKGNLRRLYEYARTFEAGGFKGLYQFIRYVDSIMQNGTKMPAPDGEANAVSLITIHHSKGLQYPICFVSGTGAILNSDDLKPQLLADEYLGCATKLCNAGPFSRTDTFFRKAIAQEILRQNREEEMRVLYVAMTRAKERLYVTGTPRGDAAKLQKRAELYADPKATLFATKGSSLLEWVLTALAAKGSYDDFAEVHVIDEDELDTLWSGDYWGERHELLEDEDEELEACEEDENGAVDLFVYRQKQDVREFSEQAEADGVATAREAAVFHKSMQERFSYAYPFEHLTRLPAKLSVSKLSPTVLDVFDSDASDPPEVQSDESTDRLLHTFDRVPCFGKKQATAAQRGTATHEFMQFCDFEQAEQNGVEQELARLIRERFLAPDTAEAVRMNELKAFFESDFYRSLKSAKDVYRETRFHIFLPAAQFTEDPVFAKQIEGEKLAVQGVIDLFFTDADGRLVLCDYKTDRLSDEERRDPAAAARMLTERHGTQLSYYALALSQICGRRPDRILIYSLPLGEAIEINV